MFGLTRKTLTIARHEYLVNVRRGGFIFATLLIPALGLIGLTADQDVNRVADQVDADEYQHAHRQQHQQ